MRVALIVAMEAEARPLIAALGLSPSAPPDAQLPIRHFTGRWRGLDLLLSINGKDPTHAVDQIGTQAATLNAYVTLREHAPALCINAGTAGGFVKRGAAIGDVIVSHGVVRFHDRRIPIAGFDAYGVGSYPSVSLSHMAAALQLREGAISTSDSLDATVECHRLMDRHETQAKEMEAAAIAWVASMLGVPFIALKAITDLVDGGVATETEFLHNLQYACECLSARVLGLLGWLADDPDALAQGKSPLANCHNVVDD